MDQMAGDHPLRFELTPTDWVYVARGHTGTQEVWTSGDFVPFSEVGLSPAAAVLSYGLGVFEGLKIHRTKDDRVLVFRADRHARRFQASARALLMPPFPEESFLEAIIELVQRNRSFLPTAES
ncbi:MAG: branched chain amino acid aminotransferase, partial [Gammaproteobacteria bacterium]|nr:branched chain amino acid aminotransferase [Gammaproteobacteria bacterium]